MFRMSRRVCAFVIRCRTSLPISLTGGELPRGRWQRSEGFHTMVTATPRSRGYGSQSTPRNGGHPKACRWSAANLRRSSSGRSRRKAGRTAGACTLSPCLGMRRRDNLDQGMVTVRTNSLDQIESEPPACQTNMPPGPTVLSWRSGWQIEDDTVGAQSSNGVAVVASMEASSRCEILRSVHPVRMPLFVYQQGRPVSASSGRPVMFRIKRSHCRGIAAALVDQRLGSNLFRHDRLTAALARASSYDGMKCVDR